MTTKRKQILKAIALASLATIDDLELSTGLTRKNLQDNLKATVEANLIERQRDDITGLPAYKLTKAGRAWLEKDKDDSSSKPAAKISSVTPAGGGDISPAAVASDHLPVSASSDEGAAATEPPTRDKMPVAASSGETLTALDIAVRNHNLLAEIAEAAALPEGERMDSLPQRIRDGFGRRNDEDSKSDLRQIDIELAWDIAGLENDVRRKQDTIDSLGNALIKFCGITHQLTGSVKYPLNLYECEQQLAAHIKRLQSRSMAMQATLDAAQTVIDDGQLAKESLSAEIGRLRAENKALKIIDGNILCFAPQHEATKDARYLVADSYIIIDNRQEAQRAALQIALDSGTTALLASINGAEQVVINPVWEAA